MPPEDWQAPLVGMQGKAVVVVVGAAVVVVVGTAVVVVVVVVVVLGTHCLPAQVSPAAQQHLLQQTAAPGAPVKAQQFVSKEQGRLASLH